jgi:hypothetical protein
MRRLIAPLVLCLTAPAALAATGGTIADAENGFSFAVPDGYADYPEGAAPGVLHSFARGKPDDASFAVIRIQAMGGTIGREPLVRETVERAARQTASASGVEITGFDYRKVKWKDFELDLVLTRLTNGDKKLVTLATPVPLAKQAIHVVLMGPAGDEAGLVANLQAILRSLDGRSNWLSDAERSERLGRLVGLVVGAIGGVAIVVWWRRRKRAQS